MIKSISNTLLRVDEEVGLYNAIAKALLPYGEVETQVKLFIDNLASSAEESNKAVHQTKGNEYTVSVNKLDKTRDNGFVTFRDVVKALTYSINKIKAENADRLEAVIRSHGWCLQREGAKVQTSIMNSLEVELLKPENQNSITILSIMDLYNDMIVSNNNYNNGVKQKLSSIANKEQFDHSDIYKKMRSAGDELFKAIEVLYKMNGSNTYKEMATQINTITEGYMTTARARKTKTENQKVELIETQE